LVQPAAGLQRRSLWIERHLASRDDPNRHDHCNGDGKGDRSLANFDSPSRVTTGQITASKNATISVDSTTRAVRRQTTRDGFFFATGDANATAKTQHSVSACIGSGGKIKAANALSITSAVSDAMDYLSAGENGSTPC
jgi:hypothetical protein